MESLEFRVNPPCPPLKGGSGECRVVSNPKLRGACIGLKSWRPFRAWGCVLTCYRDYDGGLKENLSNFVT